MRWFKSPISSPITAFNFRPHVLDDRQVGIIFPDRTNFNIFQKGDKTYSINSSIKTKIQWLEKDQKIISHNFQKWKKNNERSHQHNDSANNVSNLSPTFLSPLFRYYWLDDPIVHLSSCCGIRILKVWPQRNGFDNENTSL